MPARRHEVGRSLTFRRQLVVAFGGLLGVVAIAAVVLLGRFGAVDGARTSIAERTAPHAAALSAAGVDMKAMANDERGFLMTGDPTFREEIADRTLTIHKELAQASKAAPGPEDAALTQEITEGFERWSKALEAELTLFATDRDASIDLALGENRDLRKAYEKTFKVATTNAAAKLDASLTDIDDGVRAARMALLLSLLVLAGLAIVGGVWLDRRTRRRLAPLVAALRSLDEHCVNDLDRGLGAMAGGDLTVPVVSATERVQDAARDQIGEAYTATNGLIAKIHASIASYNGMRDQLDDLVSEIAGSSRALSSASQQMASTSGEAGRAVGEIAGAVGEVARGAERQVRMVESTRIAVQEAARGAAASSDTAQATAEAAENARRAAQDGVDAAEDATAAIQQVASSSEQVASAIQALSERSGRIGGIVDTISGIAQQTNLLALNAAIEAARAGDQGKGFAVVAEEVRKLAEEAQDAAAQIAALVGEIQSETTRAVDVVASGAQRTQDGVTTVRRTREAFERIGGAIDEMSARVTEIASSVGQIAVDAERAQSTVADVASVAEESSASAEQVSAATQQTSASTQEIAASADGLAGTAAQLDRLVGRFTVSA